MDVPENHFEPVNGYHNRASEIVGNTNFSEIDTLLSQGRDTDYIARHYHMDLPLARPIRRFVSIKHLPD